MKKKPYKSQRKRRIEKLLATNTTFATTLEQFEVELEHRYGILWQLHATPRALWQYVRMLGEHAHLLAQIQADRSTRLSKT